MLIQQNAYNMSLMFDTNDYKLDKSNLFRKRISFNELIQWGFQNNCIIRKLKLIEAENENRYFVASEDIKKNETFLKIPQNLCLAPNLNKYKLYKEILDKIQNLDSSPIHIFFRLYILLNSSNSNDLLFTPINFLPRTYSNFPYFYNKNDLIGLKDTLFIEVLENILSNKKQEFIFLKKNFEFLNNFSWDDYLSTIVLTSSRIFNVKGRVNEEFDDTMMVPIADLINHSSVSNASWWFNTKESTFEVYAKKSIKKNELITFCYGQSLGNFDLLMSYGFTIDDDHKGKIHILCNSYLPFDSELINNNQYLKIKSYSLQLEVEFFGILKQLRPFRELVYVMNSKQTIDSDINFDDIISMTNEIETINCIVHTLKKMALDYPTTLESDIYSRNKCLIGSNKRNILNVIIQEKKVKKY